MSVAADGGECRRQAGRPRGTYNCRGFDYRTGSMYVAVARIVIKVAQR